MNTSSNNNNIESKNQSVYVTVANGIVQDVFPDRDTAIKDMHRHVYNTLVGCCGGKVEGDGETCCVVSYQDKEQNDICMVVPFDPNNSDHREAYNAQRSIWHLPELPAMTESEGIKVGDKVRHNLTGDRVAMVTGIRRVQGYKWDGEITVYRLDFGESVKGPCGMEMNGGEYQREAFTLQEVSEIKPKATESEVESLTAKYAKQIEESALMGCGCMVGDGDETRKDSKCVKVRTAYKNDSHDAKDWTYCVSWYNTIPIKGDADGQHQTLRECENGILLDQAARHMAYFELMARKGWTLDEILYGKAA